MESKYYIRHTSESKRHSKYISQSHQTDTQLYLEVTYTNRRTPVEAAKTDDFPQYSTEIKPILVLLVQGE